MAPRARLRRAWLAARCLFFAGAVATCNGVISNVSLGKPVVIHWHSADIGTVSIFVSVSFFLAALVWSSHLRSRILASLGSLTALDISYNLLDMDAVSLLVSSGGFDCGLSCVNLSYNGLRQGEGGYLVKALVSGRAFEGALRDLALRDILGLDTNPGRSPVAAHWCDLAPMHCVWRGAGVDSPLSKLVAAGVPVPGAQM